MPRISGIKSKLTACILLCALLLSGCQEQMRTAGQREIGQMALVETMGADGTDQGVTLSVSTNAARSGSDKGAPTVLVNRAASMAAALEEMTAYTPKRFLFFGHVRHLVLGEATAEAGIAPFLDYMERVVEMRLDTNIYIVKDGTARQAITGKQDVSAMLDSLDAYMEQQSRGHVFTVGDVALGLAENGTAMVTAVALQNAAAHQPGTEGEMLVFAGYALIRDGKLVAYADPDCARGINLLTERAKNGVMEIDDGLGGTAALRMNGAKLHLEPVLDSGRLTGLRVRAELELNLEELSHSIDPADSEALARLEARAAAQAREDMERALKLAQGLGADFYGLGTRLELADRRAYDALPGDWAAEFAALPIEVGASAEIARSYDIAELVPVTGAGQ